MAPKEASNEIKLTRIYDAPVKLVWDAWVDSNQVGKWWGPRGFTLTTHSKDFRPGGHWKYTMHGPDGTDFPNITHYHEIVTHEKMVYDHGATENTPPMFRVTVLFTPLDGKTKMDMTMALPTPEAAENTRKFIKKAGGDSTWDRLAEYLESNTHHKETFVINRSFDTSVDQLYDMWAKPEHLSRWLAPTGFTMEIVRGGVATGSSVFYFVSNDSGKRMYGHVDFLKVERPKLMVSTQQFCDEHEKPMRHPMAPTWPVTVLRVVEFFEEGPTRSRVTVTWAPHGEVTPEELETFVKGKAGMTAGWTGSFDKLEELIAKG